MSELVFEHRLPGSLTGLGAFVVGPTLLAQGHREGPLAGQQFAAKDLFDVERSRTGAGNPDWLADAPVATSHARSVAALLGAGADCVGKTVTDELAYSLSGTNVHYGTPRNPAASGRIPGGSSSGSASAVASGMVELTLGTDTGGSIRVPASYCGIVGLRPTHGRIDETGVVPLAPSFDTVGLLARDGPTLALGWAALSSGAGRGAAPRRRAVHELVVAPELFALCDVGPRARLEEACVELAGQLGLAASRRSLCDPAELDDYRGAFRAAQMFEAWRCDGPWISRRRPRLGPGVAARFAAAQQVTEVEARIAWSVADQLRDRLGALLGGGALLLQPATSGVAPEIGIPGTEKEDLRMRTLSLTAPAGLAGAPVVSLPLAALDGLPIGLCIVGLPGDDELLVELAARGGAGQLILPTGREDPLNPRAARKRWHNQGR